MTGGELIWLSFSTGSSLVIAALSTYLVAATLRAAYDSVTGRTGARLHERELEREREKGRLDWQTEQAEKWNAEEA